MVHIFIRIQNTVNVYRSNFKNAVAEYKLAVLLS